MRLNYPEDLHVFRRARDFALAVFAITSTFHRDLWLLDQLNDSAESVASNIAEGFRQSTDRSFARYLGIAAGSLEECRTHLLAARARGHLSSPRCEEMREEATQIGRMLAALIAYLVRSNRRNRFR